MYKQSVGLHSVLSLHLYVYNTSSYSQVFHNININPIFLNQNSYVLYIILNHSIFQCYQIQCLFSFLVKCQCAVCFLPGNNFLFFCKDSFMSNKSCSLTKCAYHLSSYNAYSSRCKSLSCQAVDSLFDLSYEKHGSLACLLHQLSIVIPSLQNKDQMPVYTGAVGEDSVVSSVILILSATAGPRPCSSVTDQQDSFHHKMLNLAHDKEQSV